MVIAISSCACGLLIKRKRRRFCLSGHSTSAYSATEFACMSRGFPRMEQFDTSNQCEPSHPQRLPARTNPAVKGRQ